MARVRQILSAATSSLSKSAVAGWHRVRAQDPTELVTSHRHVALVYPMNRLMGEEAMRLAESVTATRAKADALSADDRCALGTALARLGRLSEAMEQFDQVSAGKLRDALVARNRGVVLTELFRNEAASSVLAPLAAMPGAPRSVLAAYGDALMRTGRKDDAAEVYRRALARWRHDTWFLARLSALGRSQGTDTDAFVHLRRESRHRSDIGEQIRLGREFLQAGLVAEALDLSSKLVRRAPDHGRVLLLRAETLAQAGEVEEAVRTLRIALEKAPLDGGLHTSAAFLLRDVGLLDNALAESGRACQLSPGDVRVLATHALILEDLRRPHEAVDYLDRAISLDPGSAWLYGAKAGTLHRAGRPQDALEAVETGLVKHPGQSGLLDRKAMLLVDLRRPDEAISLCGILLARDPANVDALASRAIALHKLGRDHEALADADRALAMGPGNHRCHFARGDALAALGRFDEAAAAYHESYRLSPSELTARRRADAESRVKPPTPGR